MFSHSLGVYYITPTTTPEEQSAGLVLRPQILSVTVTNAPLLNADFIQMLVSVEGSVSRVPHTPF